MLVFDPTKLVPFYGQIKLKIRPAAKAVRAVATHWHPTGFKSSHELMLGTGVVQNFKR